MKTSRFKPRLLISLLSELRHQNRLCACLFCMVLGIFTGSLQAQKESQTDQKSSGNSFAIFPAISYSPETKLTLGAIGYYYMDFSRGEAGTRKSFFRQVIIFTTAKQLIFNPRWEIFTYKEKFFIGGQFDFRKFPFRNYGLTNDGTEELVEHDLETGESKRLNYLRYSTWTVWFRPVFLRQIRPGLYAGLQYNFNQGFRYQRLPDSVDIAASDAPTILGVEENGLETRISGIGLALNWDRRDHTVTPASGHLVNFNSLHYGSWLGSKHSFHTFEIDARVYRRLVKDKFHVLALRARTLLSGGLDADKYPVAGLAEIGGREHVPGYYRGTFRGRNMITAQAEYRMLFWKRWGGSLSLSTGNTFNSFSDDALGKFHGSVGLGGRYWFNQRDNTYLRMDFAVGFYRFPVNNKRPTGLYFTMGETF